MIFYIAKGSEAMKTQILGEGIRFCSVKTDKFKTCRVNISLAMPLDRNAASRAVLPFMLQRRCAECPDYISLNYYSAPDSIRFCSSSSSRLQRVKRNCNPPIALFSTTIFPLWNSTAFLTIERPNPDPPFFLVLPRSPL